MDLAWGVAVLVLSLLCWGGQVVSWFAPSLAVRLTLMEAEESVDPSYFADIRGEALWDTLTLWTMAVCGALLAADNASWAYFGLVGGGMYVYFAGRGILTRLALRRHGRRLGAARNVRAAFAALTVWGVMALITIAASVVALATP